MTKPAFITFTGADDNTDVADMVALSAQYPVEFGILFSPKRQGTARYPSLAWINNNLSGAKLRLAAHLCGGDARDVLHSGKSAYDKLISEEFMRVQINTAEPDINIQMVWDWACDRVAMPILQCRDQFPDDTRVQWLFDASGGRGIAPEYWPPTTHANAMCGYAGGLNPGNVVEAVAAIEKVATVNYWIDMETGVRDADDKFSIAMCRQVCELVYGVRS